MELAPQAGQCYYQTATPLMRAIQEPSKNSPMRMTITSRLFPILRYFVLSGLRKEGDAEFLHRLFRHVRFKLPRHELL